MISFENLQEKELAYPCVITFKTVFRNQDQVLEGIQSVLSEKNISCEISDRESRQGKFISYTITANFPTDKCLRETCTEISGLEGFMMLF